jgi:hypothetical protein
MMFRCRQHDSTVFKLIRSHCHLRTAWTYSTSAWSYKGSFVSHSCTLEFSQIEDGKQAV